MSNRFLKTKSVTAYLHPFRLIVITKVKGHKLSYLAAIDNSTMEVAAAAVPGWKVPIGAEAEKSAIYIFSYSNIKAKYVYSCQVEMFY